MRIDYSEPKKAYVSGQGASKPRKEPAGLLKIAITATAAIAFAAGFGTGWHFSQKSAKKSFQAAIEQSSLENSAKKDSAPPKPVQPAQPVQTPTAPQTQPDPAAAQQSPAAAQQPAPAPPAATAEQPLSFYKNLPSGQKSNVIGSGINVKDDKAKQPLQAPVPSNLAKPAPVAAPAAAPKAGGDKTAAKAPDNAGLTVQVASFALKSEAETLKGKLAGKGYNAFIVESHQGDKGTWYRVRVGRKLEADAAKELAAKLGKTAMVIPDRAD